MPSLSKSKYQAGLQCPRQLWLQCNRYRDRDPLTEEQKARFARGTDIGLLAHRLFPGGEVVQEDHFHADEAIAHTRSAMGRADVPAIFEAAFRHCNLVIRADLLARNEDGTWDLHEVKSSGYVRPQHVTDAAIQTWAIEGNGPRVRGIFLTHPNSGSVPAEGDPWDYFTAEDLTSQARGHIAEVDRNVAEQNRLIVLPEPPETPFGPHCESPYRCSHFDYCHRSREQRA